MFKQYRIKYEDGVTLDFFVHSKGTRNGFMHRACVLGSVPRIDDMNTNWSEYQANDRKLIEKRCCKVSYLNRTWESYGGQTCLVKLWEQLEKLKFVDMQRAAKVNPFKSNDEPEHEDLWDPEELFDQFKKR